MVNREDVLIAGQIKNIRPLIREGSLLVPQSKATFQVFLVSQFPFKSRKNNLGRLDFISPG